MTHDIIVGFGTDDDHVDFVWRTLATPIADRWIAALRQAIPAWFFETDRFYDFPNSRWTKTTVAADIASQLHIIETYRPGTISLWPTVEMPQDRLNDFHLYFERLRGAIHDPAPFFKEAPPPVRRAITDLNIAIHRYESFIADQPIASRRIVCTFNDMVRHELVDSDYALFTMKHGFGSLYIGYCEVGKTIDEVFRDDDHVVTEGNIRPQRHYSADFTMVFHDPEAGKVDQFFVDFNQWFERNAAWLRALGFVQHDPKLAIGFIPVATLQTSLTQDEVIAAIAPRQHLHSVRLG